MPGSGNDVYDIAFSEQSNILAIGAENGRVYLWNIATKKVIATFTIPGKSNSVVGLAFSPNGKMLATIGSNEKAYLWDMSWLSL